MSVDPYGFPDPTTKGDAPTSQPVTRWVTIVGVPLLAFLFTIAYNAMRMNQWILADMSGVDRSTLIGFGTAASVAGLVVGALVGAAVGGAGATVVGLLAYVAGAVLMATGSYAVGLVLTSLGRYCFNVGVVASLARGPRNEGSRVAMFALLYAGLNLGALFNSPMSWIAEMVGPTALLGACSGLAIVAVVIAVPIFFLQLLRPPESSEQVSSGLSPELLVPVGITAAIVAPTYVLWELGGSLQWRGLDGSFGSLFFLLNPVIAIGSATLLGVVAGGASLARVQAPALIVAGVGGLLLALGLLPSALGDLTFAALPLLIGQVMFGLGEPLFFAGVQARLLGGVHWRLAPVFAALLSACGLFASFVSSFLQELPFGGVTGSVLGVGVLLGALGLASYGVYDLRKRTPAVGTPVRPGS